MHKLSENYDVRLGSTAQDITSATTTHGTGVDCKDMEDDCMAILQIGTMVGTHTCDVKIQESDASGSGYADISGAAFTQADQDDDDTIAAIGFKRTKRYVRVVVTTAGTVTTNQIAVSLLLKAIHGASDLNSATLA
jgi:hypothetical protein